MIAPDGCNLIIKGNTSQYSKNKLIVRCTKKIGERNLLPCRYNQRVRQYKHVEFPKPLKPLYAEQEKVLGEMEEKCKSTVSCNTVFCHLYTGFGKSALSAVFGARKNGPILIICGSDTVRKGWVGSFKEFFGIDIHAATGNDLGKHDVCVLSIQLATRHKFGRDAYSYYKTVICDEADTLCTQLAIDELLDMSPQYFIGLSATVKCENGLDRVLDVFWNERKHWITRLKEFGESCSMNLHILYTPYNIPTAYKMTGGVDWTGMATTVANIEERNIMIRNLCIAHRDSKILILCKLKDQVMNLVTLLRELEQDVTHYIGKDKQYYDAHILVATLSKAGRGYDDKQVSAAFDGRRFNVLILTMTMKNTDQAFGRALRGSNVDVYLLVDQNSIMKSHAEETKKKNTRQGAKIYEEYL